MPVLRSSTPSSLSAAIRILIASSAIEVEGVACDYETFFHTILLN